MGGALASAGNWLGGGLGGAGRGLTSIGGGIGGLNQGIGNIANTGTNTLPGGNMYGMGTGYQGGGPLGQNGGMGGGQGQGQGQGGPPQQPQPNQPYGQVVPPQGLQRPDMRSYYSGGPGMYQGGQRNPYGGFGAGGFGLPGMAGGGQQGFNPFSMMGGL